MRGRSVGVADMADLRRYVKWITVILIVLANLYYGSLALNSAWLYDHQGRYLGTIPQWFNTYAATLTAHPEVMVNPGWDPAYFYAVYFAVAFIVCGFVAQGGRTVKARRFDGHGVAFTVLHHRWKNRLGGLEPIDCNWQYLIYLVVMVPLQLSIYGVGAYLNLFHDPVTRTTFYVWHFLAHFLASRVLMSLMATADVEWTLNCNYRWKWLILMGILIALSWKLEYTENLMVWLAGGITGAMENHIIDFLFDVLGVTLGGHTALSEYNDVMKY